MTASAARSTIGSSRHGRLFWFSVGFGLAVMGFGVWGLLARSGSTHPPAWALWVLGLNVIHDAIVAPAVFAVGMVLRRRIPGRFRAPLQVALFLTGVTVLLSLPVLLGLRGVRDNPTYAPRNYAAGLAIVLAVVWSVTALFLLRAWRAAPTTPKDAGSEGSGPPFERNP